MGAHEASKTPAGGEGDIRYEVALLGQFAERWAEHFRDKQQDPAAYAPGQPRCIDFTALLEGALMHVRNVLEFLMRATDPETRSAVQFAPDWDPDEVKARRGSLYGDICGFLSHIAVRRPDPPTSWLIIDICDEVLREYEAFLPRVTQGNVDLLREGAEIARAALDGARLFEIGTARHEP